MMKEYNSTWCNGSTRDFGSLSLSSSLGVETKNTNSMTTKTTPRSKVSSTQHGLKEFKFVLIWCI